MNYFNFNTDGSKDEIANIVEQQLEINNKKNQFDVEKETERYRDEQGNNSLRVFINETDLEKEEDFSHEIIVEEIDVHEYRANLKLIY